MNGRYFRMSAGGQVRLERLDPSGRPAAMVATWMMGELLHIPEVTVYFEHPDLVTLEAASGCDLERVRVRVAALLEEPRFARWKVSDASPERSQES